MTATPPINRRPKKRANGPSATTRRWIVRGAVAALAGLMIGATGGVITVRTLEPGRANAVDSVQAVLDSLARGTIPEPTAIERQQETQRRADSVAQAAADSAAEAVPDVLLPVPDVIGLEEGPARDRMRDAGLLVGEVLFRASRSPAGTVLATTPPAGSLLAATTAITLYISDGRTPVDTSSTLPLHPVP